LNFKIFESYILQNSKNKYHTVPTAPNRCNIDVWALAQSRGDGHRSLVTPERVWAPLTRDTRKGIKRV